MVGNGALKSTWYDPGSATRFSPGDWDEYNKGVPGSTLWTFDAEETEIRLIKGDFRVIYYAQTFFGTASYSEDFVTNENQKLDLFSVTNNKGISFPVHLAQRPLTACETIEDTTETD